MILVHAESILISGCQPLHGSAPDPIVSRLVSRATGSTHAIAAPIYTVTDGILTSLRRLQ